MNAVDPDDEAAMAYFLPNGIADDSPPKPIASSRFAQAKSSFGPIGTPSSAAATTFFGPSLAPGGSSPAVQEFAAGPSLLRPSVLNHSPFRTTPDSSSAGSPHQGNYLLSDLGGKIHEPSRNVELRDVSSADAASRAARAGFGFPGSLRSPSSRMFESTSDGSRGLPLTRARNFSGTPRSLSGLGPERDFDSFGDRPMRTSSSSFDMGTVVSSTGFGSVSPNTSLVFGASSEDSLFAAPPIRNWPPHASTSVVQPRKVLSTPPGLSPPSRKDNDSPHSQMSREGSAIQTQPNQGAVQSSSYDPFGNVPMSTAGEIGPYGNMDSRSFGAPPAHIGSHLTSLTMAHDVFGVTSPQRLEVASLGLERVSNRELAELNTQSIKMDDVVKSNSVSSDGSPTQSAWQDTSSARRIEVQSKTKSGRSQHLSTRQRGRTETSLDIHGGSPLSLSRSEAASPGSPLYTLTSMDSSAATSTSTSHGSSPEGKLSSGKIRRQQNASIIGSNAGVATSSYAVVVGGNSASAFDGGVKKSIRETRLQPDSSDSVIPKTASTVRDSTKSKRRDPVTDSKSVAKSASSKKTILKAVSEKNYPSISQSTASTFSSVSRRQVYREKQKTETKSSEENNVSENSQLTVARKPPAVETSPIAPHSEVQSETPIPEPKTDVKSRRRRQKDSKDNKEPKQADEPLLTKEVVETTTLLPKSHEEGQSTNTSTAIADAVASNKSTTQAKAVPSARKVNNSSVLSDETAKTTLPETADAPVPETSKQTVVEPTTADLEQVKSCVSNDGSSSDIEKAQLSTDDEYEVPSHPHLNSEDATSADEASQSGVLGYGPGFSRTTRKADKANKKNTTKERKEKQKKEKLDRKKSSKTKKDKRSHPSGPAHATEQPDELLAGLPERLNRSSPSNALIGTAKNMLVWLASIFVTSIVNAVSLWKQFVQRANLKVGLAVGFSYVESVLAVVFSVVLLLALHGASWFIRIHRVAFRALLSHRHIGFCFAFLYGFPALVQHVFPWAPPWAPVCLWYAFLVQLFCTNGSTAMVTSFRIILPLVFLVEGISHHSFLLDLNGAELLLTSFILSALKTSNLCSPIFFMSLAAQCLLAVFLGSELVVQWVQLAVALYSLHLMAATEDWVGLGDDDDEMAYHHQQQQHHHHSIADYNHPAPSGAVSIQKTKRLDRRALAYVRGRKFR